MEKSDQSRALQLAPSVFLKYSQTLLRICFLLFFRRSICNAPRLVFLIDALDALDLSLISLKGCETV
jgi:hypothetical protein